MATLTQSWRGWAAAEAGGGRWRGWGTALGWWLLGFAAGVPALVMAAYFPNHLALSVLGALALTAAALAVIKNPAWGACALIVIVYWNLSDVVHDAWGFGWVLRLALTGVALAGVLEMLLSQPRRWRWPVLGAMLAYGAAQVLSTPGAIEPGLAGGALLDYGKDMVVFYLVANLLRTPGALRRGVNAVLAGVMLLSAPVVYQGLTGSANQFWGFGSMLYKEIVPGEWGWRMGGAIGDPNFLAMVLVAALPLALIQVLEPGAPLGRRVMAILAAVLALVATFYTYSRASLLGIGLIVIVLAVKHPRRKRVLAGAAAVLLTAMALMPGAFFSRLATLTEITQARHEALPDQSFQIRLNADLAGMLMFKQHPFFGVGAGNYPVNYLHYSELSGLAVDPTLRDPHNLYIQIAAETGLAGLVSFAALLWMSFRVMERGRRRLRQLRADRFADLIWALELAVLTYLSLSLFLHAAYFRHFLLLLMLGTLAGTLALEQAGATSTGQRALPGNDRGRSPWSHAGAAPQNRPAAEEGRCPTTSTAPRGA